MEVYNMGIDKLPGPYALEDDIHYDLGLNCTCTVGCNLDLRTSSCNSSCGRRNQCTNYNYCNLSAGDCLDMNCVYEMSREVRSVRQILRHHCTWEVNISIHITITLMQPRPIIKILTFGSHCEVDCVGKVVEFVRVQVILKAKVLS